MKKVILLKRETMNKITNKVPKIKESKVKNLSHECQFKDIIKNVATIFFFLFELLLISK